MAGCHCPSKQGSPFDDSGYLPQGIVREQNPDNGMEPNQDVGENEVQSEVQSEGSEDTTLRFASTSGKDKATAMAAIFLIQRSTLVPGMGTWALECRGKPRQC